MKTLLILRHAKSSWKDPSLQDHDRPLNKRGKRDAPRMGRFMRHEDLVPDVVLCSTAVRARSTARLALEAADGAAEILLTQELYLAPPSEYVRLLGELDDAFERAMIVGHNPGVEDLVTLLTGDEETMPTAALARVGLAIARWRDLTPAPVHLLLGFWRPKELRD
jgi:phosphohistidine phosphatase